MRIVSDCGLYASSRTGVSSRKLVWLGSDWPGDERNCSAYYDADTVWFDEVQQLGGVTEMIVWVSGEAYICDDTFSYRDDVPVRTVTKNQRYFDAAGHLKSSHAQGRDYEAAYMPYFYVLGENTMRCGARP